MKEPWFWRDDGFAARAAAAALTPAALIYDCGQRLRAALSSPAKAAAPVICIGNATLGGVGKTPFALMLQRLLKDNGVTAHFLSRGYGGSLNGPALVLPQHIAAEVGDEPLLLSAAAPTWIAKNRAAGAMAAAKGADVVIMDDGFQNKAIAKDIAILLVAAKDPCGNGRIFPAGPLREPLARAISRADAVVIVGEGEPKIDFGARPVFRASSTIETAITPKKLVAFCGIGAPDRFFSSLEAKGFALAAKVAFPDHHVYSPSELQALRKQAANENAQLMTTEKDYVRLAAADREGVETAKLKMTVDDPERLVLSALAAIRRTR